MRWPPQTAIVRRDTLLARTRWLSVLVAGAAGAASIVLATILGQSIPGRAATTTTTGTQPPAGPSPARTPTRTPTKAPTGGQHGTTGTRHHHHHLAPPTQPPSTSSAPPVTKSGGS
jgi:hypothetical protein